MPDDTVEWTDAQREELRERILSSHVEPIESELLDDLRHLPQVASASASWFHGWVEINVGLNKWTWDAHAGPNDLIDAFARDHVREFSVTHRFHPPTLTRPHA